MQPIKRKPFQGVLNVINFNWHFYVLGLGVIIVLLFIRQFLNQTLQTVLLVFIFLSLLSILLSLVTTFYVYDYSNFYTLEWSNVLNLKNNATVINIHAGFDETSEIIQHKFSPEKLLVFDFYNPKKHTEISIERARKHAKIFPGTRAINTENFHPSTNADYIFLLLAAHEIRDEKERILFFNKLQSALNINGKIIVAEHLRNISNFIAYNMGTFHFFSKKKWKSTFENAKINSISEIKLNSFITAFVLTKQ